MLIVTGDLSGASSDFTTVTDMDLTLTCGCSGLTPSPAVVSQPVSTMNPISQPVSNPVAMPITTTTSTSTCDGDFELTSSVASLLEGCFIAGALATSTLYGEVVYAHGDTYGTVGIYAIDLGSTGSSVRTPRLPLVVTSYLLEYHTPLPLQRFPVDGPVYILRVMFLSVARHLVSTR